MSKAQSKRQLKIELRHLNLLQQQRAQSFGPWDRVAANLLHMINQRESRLRAIGA